MPLIIAFPLSIFSGQALVLTFNWSSTVTLGSVIVGILLGLAGLATFGYGIRWKSNYDVEKARSDSLEDGVRAYKERADRLELQMRELRTDHDKLAGDLLESRSLVARLEQLPNLERILELMGDLAVKQDAQLDRHAREIETQIASALNNHDAMAKERFSEIITLLKLEDPT